MILLYALSKATIFFLQLILKPFQLKIRLFFFLKLILFLLKLFFEFLVPFFDFFDFFTPLFFNLKIISIDSKFFLNFFETSLSISILDNHSSHFCVEFSIEFLFHFLVHEFHELLNDVFEVLNVSTLRKLFLK